MNGHRLTINRRQFLKSMMISRVTVATLNVRMSGKARAQGQTPYKLLKRRITNADRKAAASHLRTQAAATQTSRSKAPAAPPQMNPGGVPDYFGTTANWALSPLPRGAVAALTLLEGGSNYSATPTVTITDFAGNSTDATATATVVNGEITGLTLVNGGSGYAAP